MNSCSVTDLGHVEFQPPVLNAINGVYHCSRETKRYWPKQEVPSSILLSKERIVG